MIVSAVFTIGIVICYIHKGDKEIRISNKKLLIIFSIQFIGIIILQLFIFTKPFDDLNVIFSRAAKYGRTGSFAGESLRYFTQCENNIPILIIESVIYRIIVLVTSPFNIMIGDNKLYFLTVILNALIVSISLLLINLTVKKIFKGKYAIITLILSLLFIPAWAYAGYVYTDTIGMFMCAMSIFLLCTLFTDEEIQVNGRKKLINIILLGITISAGFIIKPSMIVVMIAIILTFLFNIDKIKSKKNILIFITAIISVFVIYKFGLGLTSIYNKDLEEELKEPITHYLMLGLNHEGYYQHPHSQFSEVDYKITASCKTQAEKKQKNIQVIKERIQNYGVLGLIDHLRIKVCEYTWADGTYGAFYRVRCADHIGENHIMTRIFTSDGDLNKYVEIICQIMHYIMLLLILGLAICNIKNKESGLKLFFIIALIGAIIFYALWESCSRYILQFYPVIFITSIYGLDKIIETYKYYINKKKITK